jgi:serine/threonine protein kinase
LRFKRRNILVDSNGNVKLSDFGTAKMLGNSYLQSFIGTYCWMAPEIVLEKGHERFADIWSLGCTVYEMLTGFPPFVSDNLIKTINMVKNFNAKTF